MSMEFIQQIQLAGDVAMAMLIWMVQLIIYPGFREVAPAAFHDWHLNYMKIISRIVIPLMLIQMGCHLFLLIMQPSPLQSMAAAVILAAWIATFTLSVPCHQSLQQTGYASGTITRLIKTNWIRTICWTLPLLRYVA